MLVHSGHRILPEVNESLSKYALQKLQASGVEVLLETRVQSCTERSVSLSNGETIPSHTFVWAAGVSPNPLLAELEFPDVGGCRSSVPRLCHPSYPSLSHPSSSSDGKAEALMKT